LLAGDHIIVHFPGAGTPSAEAASALGVNGLVLANKLDDAHSAIGSSTAPNSGATTTTHHPDELLIGAIGVQGHSTDSFTAGSGYTAIGRTGTNDGGLFASNVTINPEFQTVSATGAYSATGTIPNRDWGAAIATYVIDTVPVVTQPSNQFNTEGDAVNLQIVASDSDGDPLTYSQTGLPPGLTLNPGTGLITGNVNTLFADHGPYTVNVTATDPAGHSDTKSFTWTVTNVAPIVVDPQTYGVTETVPMTLPAPGVLSGAIDPGNEALQAVLDTNVSNGLLTLNSDGSFTYTSNSGFHGTDSFTFHATDGVANSNVATVSLVTSDVTPPVFTAPLGNQTSNEGDTVSLADGATDADVADTLLYSATGLPNGLVINSSTGQISGTILGTAADLVQPFNVDVSVTDGVNTTHNLFTWTVNNLAPVVTANNLTLAEGIPSGTVTVGTFTDVGGPEPMWAAPSRLATTRLQSTGAMA
jgi:VCBS repeat-containing protein